MIIVIGHVLLLFVAYRTVVVCSVAKCEERARASVLYKTYLAPEIECV